jgi:DNA-binding transcriptional LysR family regulator
MRLTQCAALVAIADNGTFSRAATRLRISQSAVSHAVSSLESELGCALMERDRTGVAFTDCGLQVLDHARAMMAHADAVHTVAESARDGASGTIRFATSQSFAMHLLPELLRQFREVYPRQRIRLREGSDPQIARWLRRRDVDLGVVTLPKDGLTTVPLWRDELRLLVPADHELAVGAPVTPYRLAAESLVMPQGGVEDLLRAALRTSGVEPRVLLRLADLGSLLAMVAAGLGCTVLPARALRGLPPGVTEVPLAFPITRHVALGLTGGATHPSRAVRTLIGIARDLAA